MGFGMRAGGKQGQRCKEGRLSRALSGIPWQGAAGKSLFGEDQKGLLGGNIKKGTPQAAYGWTPEGGQ